ncbi:universal stress protein [Emcibacter sp. SYSU 3D8]|uniref:universal stress protein n=1 Tax=Emcibacter sp. SYSU 3D8 TaxID=3133969 RepID=UPI0031FEBCDA
MFSDILVPLMNVPDDESGAILERIAATAATLGGAVSGIAVEIEYAQPVYMYADAVVFMSQAFKDAQSLNHARVEALVRHFEEQAGFAGVASESEIVGAGAGDVPGLLAQRARLHDLTMFVLDDDDPYARNCVEGVVFGSGRPVLVLPRAAPAAAMKKIVVAWDFSREAARAFADAMPVLRQAESVTVLHVTDDGASWHPGAKALERHLARLDIGASYVQTARGTASVDEALEAHASHNGADLIVMGAYGHSRLREFVLGGVTRAILKAPAMPVLLSH